MFGGRSKKEPEKKKRRDLSAYGLFDLDGITDDGTNNDDSGGDSDLEAELAAITSGGGGGRRPKPQPKPVIPTDDLDRMVAASLRDIDSDKDLSDDDDGDDDPDLLNELSTLTGNDVVVETEAAIETPPNDTFAPTTAINQADTIKSRLEMYKMAESNAKELNDMSRARRFNRGLKTLQDLLKQVNSGKTINIDDIPPEVTVKPIQKPTQKSDVDKDEPATSQSPKVSPVRPAPAIPTSSNAAAVVALPSPILEPVNANNLNQAKIDILLARQREYKMAALSAKKSGEMQKALQFVKIVKLFDTVLQSARDGQTVDLSDMPPPPNELQIDVINSIGPPSELPKKEESEVQQSTQEDSSNNNSVTEDGLITATSVSEALQQHLNKYLEVEKAAKDEGNSSKARRIGRIVKQYQDAVKLYKAGKTVPFDELPTPPGFAPIPVASVISPRVPAPTVAPTKQPQPLPKPSEPVSSSPPQPPPRPPLRKQDSRISGNHSSTTLMNKTIDTLLQRQKEFKDAAIEAKKAGEIEEAKGYLKIYKGFDILLDTARGGLPIDFSTLPIPPSQRANLENSFVHVNDADIEGDPFTDISHRLEEQLQKQLLMCKTTRDHHKALGDVAGTNRFENLALGLQKDLDFIRLARNQNLPIPKFHYEDKNFNIVRCNTDLADSELEINVIRGIGYNVKNPKDIDTYVKVEFPYPQETPFQTRTQVIRNTDSPEYNEKFVTEIQPKARNCQRVFKRHGIKFELYSKGSCWFLSQCCTNIPQMCCFSGFLRSDTLIGTVTVKLQPLETSCEIHDSFDLMDGRKQLGGKLEIKIRIRNPILTKQIEQIHEKWLIIDS